ncbi:hypothetical protein [Herbaspirillum robiniae]|uniref:ABM domain-containing protein n=1 Tax=Herbaspirillum robiniae TaxID=2014887 RepID=A0ABX2LYE4_9BURK|nr:hypothetical protein [Herbaspirillum robiniae]NUU03141.1 hypothetical protein [Herbaspirillum robiniae]
MMTEAMELTTFHLAPGVTMKEFIAANADVDAWLRQQPGFILRRTSRRADGLVTDMLLWASVSHGQRAARGIVTELAGSPVHAAIDHATVDWSVSPCLHRVH